MSWLDTLHDIFRTSGLRPPPDEREQGAPLYAYRVSEQQHEKLRRVVRDDIRQRVRMSGHAAGMFCLYAAEQLCRHYRGGTWKWQLVTAPIEWEPDYAEIRQAVREGMHYWRRPIVQTATQQRLLATLVCEGGLPLQILAEGRDRHLKDFFRSVISQAERHKVAAVRVIDRYLGDLPQSLQNDTVAELVAQLADAVIHLRQLIPPSVSGDPLSALSKRDPTWTNKVPLRVDEAAFSELLRGLLREPRSEALSDSPLEIVAGVHRAPLRLERRAAVRPETSVASLAQLLGLPAEELQTHVRITLSLLAANGERHVVAIARLNNEREHYRLERLPDSPVRHEGSVQQPILLAASVGGREIACVEPPGGEALLDGVPWVFESGDGAVRDLRRQGSYRSGSRALLVAVPPGLKADVSQGSSTPADGTLLGRELVTVTGHVSWRGPDELWMVQTAADADPDQTYCLSGNLSRAGFSGSEYWLGTPKVFLLEPSGLRSEVSRHAIQVRSSTDRVWKALGQALGHVDLRVRDGEKTLYRTRLLTLPEDFRLELDSKTASVTVSSEQLVSAMVDGQTASTALRGRCRISVAGREAASTFVLRLRFRSGDASLTVPTPFRRAEFIGRDGPVQGSVVLDRLGQVRVRAVSPDPTERYGLEARVPARTPWTQLIRLPATGNAVGVWELALDTIREQLTDFFALSYDLDVEIELRVSVYQGAPLPSAPILRIRRYEVMPLLAQDAESIEIVIDDEAASRLGDAGLALLQLELRPLDAPDTVPAPISRDTKTRWTVPRAALSSEPHWLITGRIRERVRLRPLVVEGASSPSISNELERLIAVKESDPRRAGLRSLLASLAPDWDRPEWDLLAQFLSTLGTLPSTTFDVVDALSQVPAAAASALIRCCGTEEALGKVWRGLDELPFLWEAVPLDAWIAAANALAGYAASISKSESGGLSCERATQLLLNNLIDAGHRLSHFFTALHGVIFRTVDFVPPPANDPFQPFQQRAARDSDRALMSVRALVMIEAQDLLRRHEGEWWPTDVSVRDESGAEMVDSLGIGNIGAPHAAPVLRVPFLAGIAAGSNLTIDSKSLLSMRRVRTFDPAWFEFAHAMGFTYSAAQRLPVRKK